MQPKHKRFKNRSITPPSMATLTVLLKTALSEVQTHCTEAGLKADRQKKIDEKQSKVAERQQELKEAQQAGNLDKIAKKQKKLTEAQAELKQAQAE